jgi:plastocyanin
MAKRYISKRWSNKTMVKGEKVSRGGTLSVAIGTIMLSIILFSVGAAAQNGGVTWQVLVGGETSNMAVQGTGFYPGVIIINEGDTINWTLGGHLEHTVSFLDISNPSNIPDPGSPQVLLPVGGSTYNGTGEASSGLLVSGTTHSNYSLTFTKVGTYNYMCFIHPGMSGVVIVQPPGSPYPATQDNYTVEGKSEMQTDIATGQNLANNVSVTNTSGANGTTIYNVPIDIPLSVNTASVILSPKNNSNVTGTATLNFISPGNLTVSIIVSNLTPNSTHPAHIHKGSSAAGGPILYPLNNVTADANGTGTSTTTISGPPWFAIATKGWFINVHQGPTMVGAGATPISSGDIVRSEAMYARFTPQNLTINVNDQVVWTVLNPIEIHTVTFPAAGTEPPDFTNFSDLNNITVNPAAAAPAGGNIYNNSSVFYNSGILALGSPASSYSLTFTTPGTFPYVCVVHDQLGMMGNITVLSPTPTPTVTVTATPTATETITVTPTTTPTTIPVPEYPASSSLVLSIAGIMLVALMLLTQNRRGK